MNTAVHYQRDGELARITLNRPQRHNAATEEPGSDRRWQSAAIESIAEGVKGVSTTARHKGGWVTAGAVLPPRGTITVRPR